MIQPAVPDEALPAMAEGQRHWAVVLKKRELHGQFPDRKLLWNHEKRNVLWIPFQDQD